MGAAAVQVPGGGAPEAAAQLTRSPDPLLVRARSVVVVIGLAALANAQAPPAPTCTIGVGGNLAMFASLPADRGETMELRRVRGSVLQEFAVGFQAPAGIVRLQAIAEQAVQRAGGVYSGSAQPIVEVRFTIRAGGGISDSHLVGSTADPALDSALLHAAARLDSAQVTFHESTGRDTLQMRLAIGVDPSSGDYPIVLVALKALGTITQPAHIQSTDVYPVISKQVLAKRIDDDILIQVLVDELGRAVPESTRVVQGTQQPYIAAILAVVPKYRWSPAMAGDCPVRQWVQMPFKFHFGKEP
jgi:hypothetical protein